jgi:hypothetical protein
VFIPTEVKIVVLQSLNIFLRERSEAALPQKNIQAIFASSYLAPFSLSGLQRRFALLQSAPVAGARSAPATGARSEQGY